jgi:glycosyltransferase involved in cell wall biosynthesis
MRILHTVEFYDPHPGGAELVVRELSERLARLGHQVTVATTFDARRPHSLRGVSIEQFKISGNAVKGITGSREEIRRYHELLGGGFDVVMNYAAQNWTSDLAFESLYRITGKKVLVPCGYSGLHRPAYSSYYQNLPRTLAAYDALVYMSHNYQDKQYGDLHGLGAKAVYIPNGASSEEFTGPEVYNFRKKFGIDTPYIALCIANHYQAKGHDFVIEAFKKMNRKDTTLVIIGARFTGGGIKSTVGNFALDYLHCAWQSLIHPRIRLVHTDDRRAVIAAYKQAQVFLFGSRVECAPLVMYESFAASLPFVTRPVGNVADHQAVLKIVSTTDEMARVANYLIDDPKTAQEVAGRAHATWQTQHTWEGIATQYEQLYQRLIA